MQQILQLFTTMHNRIMMSLNPLHDLCFKLPLKTQCNSPGGNRTYSLHTVAAVNWPLHDKNNHVCGKRSDLGAADDDTIKLHFTVLWISFVALTLSAASTMMRVALTLCRGVGGRGQTERARERWKERNAEKVRKGNKILCVVQEIRKDDWWR